MNLYRGRKLESRVDLRVRSRASGKAHEKEGLAARRFSISGLERAARTTGLPYDEVLNRATITGSIEISRLPGTVCVTFLSPLAILDRLGIRHFVRAKYGLDDL